MVTLTRKRTPGRRDGGFTMLEVMMALLVGMIGLIGTMAVQQTVLRSTATANDGAIAMRLASQRLEEFNVAQTFLGPPVFDELAALAATTGLLSAWSTAEYVDASGSCSTGKSTWTPACRWQRTYKVTNTGVALPYNISVQVVYNIDGGTPRTVRLDVERRKAF